MPDAFPPLGVTAVMLPELDLSEQIDLCRQLDLKLYSLRPRTIPESRRQEPYSNWGNHRFDLTPQRLLAEADAIRRRLDAAGLQAFGTVPFASTADDDATLELHLKGAAAVGAGRVRINPEAYPETVFDFEPWLDRVKARYREIIPAAEKLGLKAVMETHALSVAVDCGLAREICAAFSPVQIGVIFDLPNFAREGNLQPRLAVSILKPWIDHVHVGATRRVTEPAYDAWGFRKVGDQFCALTEGDLNLIDWLTCLRQAGVNAPLIIEDYTPGPDGAGRLRRTAASLRLALEAVGPWN